MARPVVVPSRLRRPWGRAAWLALFFCLACQPQAMDGPLLDLPGRPADALSGEEIVRAIGTLHYAAREERIYAEVALGNVPGWLRTLQPVRITGQVGGRMREVTFWVTPDYLAVGSDEDSFLIPLSPRTGQRIADLAGASLPTPAMVDAIWGAARVRLAPIRIPPDEHMRTLRYIVRHDRLLQGQRMLRRVPPGVFVAGHKLDVVRLTKRPAGHGFLDEESDDDEIVGLYGWHRGDGEPIQPLFQVSMDSWPTFQQGIRLVDRKVLVDGVERDISDVLEDPELAALLTETGSE